jgi:hypothetical protein
MDLTRRPNLVRARPERHQAMTETINEIDPATIPDTLPNRKQRRPRRDKY